MSHTDWKLYEHGKHTIRAKSSDQYVDLAIRIASKIKTTGHAEVTVIGHVPSWQFMLAVSFLNSRMQPVILIPERVRLESSKYSECVGVLWTVRSADAEEEEPVSNEPDMFDMQPRSQGNE